MKQFYLLLFSLLGTIVSTNAQLQYNSNGTLTFGNVSPYGAYTTNFNGYGFYFTSSSSPGDFLEMNVSTSNPRIAGTGNQIVFYNTETSTFNTIQVQSVSTMSDRRAKMNILPLTSGLDKIKRLKPVSFTWRERMGSDKVRMKAKGKPATDVGFIAQDVEQVIPDAVNDFIDTTSDVKMLNYNAIVSVLTQAVKELSDKVDSLQSRIDSLTSNHKTSTSMNNGAAIYRNNIQAGLTYLPVANEAEPMGAYYLSGGSALQKQYSAVKQQSATDPSGIPAEKYVYSSTLDKNKAADTNIQ
ncbi:hypothetical protein A9P82_08350 [Arachidicoccus ginsenosidimutans]|uniref:tail fiber domain-containing protein n=1 Tax=Arachidicoccus sp. BS20 TaxID=1850526 RepID=UPI0007F15CDA|nr:tail fiber domain-containing protein [Arachidicoccus sp. BS20]ANI89300.1 hypothetical protein A9P82_08350 [Arachidicoccus sp. BS20]